MKKAVVIGGSGFIGSHVADILTNKKYDTYIFDQKPSNWLNNKQHMLIGNILDKKSLNNALSKANFVFNFAGISDLNLALDKPIISAEMNIIGNLNILEACKNNKVDRYIFASTVYVNGSEGGFYRCSKIACEKYLEEYKRVFGLDYTILRYGSLYGPRADKNNGILKILTKAIKEKKLIYHGHKDTTREYIHVIDAAEASVLALKKEFKNKILTLTGQQTLKVIDLLKIIGEILNIPENKIKIVKKKQVGHYVQTPYAQQFEYTKKLVPNNYIDIGEGILNIVNDLKK
jgi:UDP-glucose 4-epimerase